MTTITAPLTTIALAGLVPDVVRSCIVLQPSPPPDSGEEPPDPVGDTGIYTPIAPGVIYTSLPTTTVIDTSPDQMIGCIVTVADNPQGRLNALFPSAISGDGVIDRATNDIWVYDGAVWNNVGPTPGPTIVATTVIPPWNETVLATARTRTKLEALSLAYALELLTEPDPITTVTSLLVRSAPAYIKVDATDFAVAAYAPLISTGYIARPSSINIVTAANEVSVGTGYKAAVPVIEVAAVARTVPYVGPTATVVQPEYVGITLYATSPQLASGASLQIPALDLAVSGTSPSKVGQIVPPAVISVGTSSISTGATTTYIPAHNIDDIILTIIETEQYDNNYLPTGYTSIPGSPLPTINMFTGTKLQAYWKRATTTEAGVTTIAVPDLGNHTMQRTFIIRGCRTSGNPFEQVATSTEEAFVSTVTFPSVTTTTKECLIVNVGVHGLDTFNSTFYGTPVNSNLSSLQIHAQATDSTGAGGGYCVISGVKQSIGSTGTTTATLASTAIQAMMTIAFVP